MTNRIAATYSGDENAAEHTISFTAPSPGSRLILVTSSWYGVDDLDSGWVEDHSASAYNVLAFYSKVATGSETSVTVVTGSMSPLHAVLYERDDAAQLLFETSGSGSGTAITTSAAAVPAGATGFVAAAVSHGEDSVDEAEWNQSLTQHASFGIFELYSGFAFGPLPAAGNRTWRVTGLTPSTAPTTVAVVGYGSADTSAPTVPGMLRATNVQDTTVTLEWDAATDDKGVAGYGLYLNGVKQGADQPGLSYTFTALATGVAVTLAVDAVDAVGNRSAKASLVVVPETDDEPPTVPDNLVVAEPGFTSFTVTWDASTDNVSVAGYGIWLDGVKQGPDQAALGYAFTRLERGTTYLVEVDAVDSSGNRSERAEVEATTLVGADPSEPAGLTATAGDEQITVAWGAAESGGLPIVRYEVLLDGQLIASTTGLGYVIGDLLAGSTHEVAVRAVDSGAARGQAAAVVVELPPASWTALATPTFRLGGWVGNARDAAGVEWVVEDEEGWSAGPEARTLSADFDSGDGGFSGPGRYGGRTVILSGKAVAPSRMAMLAAQERLNGELYPAAAVMLRVVEGHLTRQARVRVSGDVEITDRGSRSFEWTVTVRAADPRRYAVRGFHAEVEFAPAQTTGAATITLAGDYLAVPGALRLIGPVANPVIRHEELGLEIVCQPGTVLPTAEYEIQIDLATRAVWAIVPPEVWPEPRPGRTLLKRLPARFAFRPGPNTIRLSGEVVAGQDAGPRLVLDVTDAWI
ncbi:fibronectin type III domain-containing protein [Nonomuraea fuscirosea]|uniref:fibronectin type III domain-containing protein n=1 Tax=Nonomuraea fuscirosea TaxID=1291556 RepID=UPI0037161460